MKKIIIILGVLGVSFSAVFVKYADAPSMVLVFYRTLFASILLSPLIWLRHREALFSIEKKELFLSLLSGAFLGIHFTAYFQAVKWTSIASAVVLTDVEVFFVAFAMLVIWKDKIPWKGWLGIGVTFAGSLLIGLTDSGGGKNVLLGDGLAISAAMFMSVYTIIGSVCRKKITTMVYTYLVYMSASLTVCLILLMSQTPLVGYHGKNYLLAFAMAVFCTLLGHSVFSWGLGHEKASFVSMVKLMEPVFATLLGMLLFTEIPGMITVIGGILVLTGIIVYSVTPKKPPES